MPLAASGVHRRPGEPRSTRANSRRCAEADGPLGRARQPDAARLGQPDADVAEARQAGDLAAAGNPDDYRNKIRAILSVETLRDDEPPYSAFCKHTRIDIVGKDSDPLRLLNRVGEEMLRYRSWGRPDKYGINRVGNIEVERNFEDDHDWFKASERASGLADGRPRRAIFGLPHNYSQQFQVTAKGFDRRASPLLVHVHRLTEQSYIAVLIVMRSAFLPKDVTLKVTNRRTESYPDAAPDWTVLDTFIDGRSTSKNAPYFPDRLKVLP